MSGREYGALLHEAATFFDSHPNLPVADVHGSVAVLYDKIASGSMIRTGIELVRNYSAPADVSCTKLEPSALKGG
jgi:hypothetical protein